MSRFVRLGHHLLNADLITHVRHDFDPHRRESVLHIGFASGAEIEVAARTLGVEEGDPPIRDAVLDHVLAALQETRI
jgi:hypothetical protein